MSWDMDAAQIFQAVRDNLDYLHSIENISIAINVSAIVLAALLALAWFVSINNSTE